MKKALIFLYFVLAINLYAQEKLLVDTAAINENTKVIGRYPHDDKNKTYREFNFIVENPDEIKKIIQELELGEEVANSIEEPNFLISVIQDNKEGHDWIVNPNMKSVLTKGHTYKFDIEKLVDLHQKFPFEYNFEKKNFNNIDEYNAYIQEQKLREDFLFDYAPRFDYEGNFEIEFPKNSEFESPKKIIDYLKPLIEKISRENEYRIRYILNDKNMFNQDQITITIDGSKKLFEDLDLSDLKKENWKYTIGSGIFFYKLK